MSDSKYPEHDKLIAIKTEKDAIGEFIEWLTARAQGYTICAFDHNTDHYYPAFANINDLLAQYFDIDQAKLENENRAMLDELRQLNMPVQPSDIKSL